MINYELFQLIEKAGERGATAKELAEHTGIPLHNARIWCSRWTKKKFLKRLLPDMDAYSEKVGGVRHYPGRPECRYTCGEKEWAQLINKEYLDD